jgi:hypothetical protein
MRGLEMWCPARGCGFESRALRFLYDFLLGGGGAEAGPFLSPERRKPNEADHLIQILAKELAAFKWQMATHR